MNEKQIRKKIKDLVKDYYEFKFKKQKFIPGKTRVNYAGRIFDEKEIQAAVSASLDFWLTLGHYNESLVELFKDYLGVNDFLLVNSGSSANLIAISALCSTQLKSRDLLHKGDEIITVAACFPTTINPIIQNGLVPVFLDIELGTYNLNTSLLKQALSDKTRGIFVAHTLGNPNDLGALLNFAEEHDLVLIEDNCDALGSKYNGKLTGTIGELGTFSFYPAHHITMGEGGGICTNNKELYRIALSLRDWGRACYCKYNEKNPFGACGKRFEHKLNGIPYDHRFIYSNIGYNLKPLDIQAAIGIEQLKKFPNFAKKRNENFKDLYEIFSKYSDKFILPRIVDKVEPCWFGFPITIKENSGFNRKNFIEFLERNGIQTRLIFTGNILYHPAYKQIKHRIASDLTNTEIVFRNSFFLGVYPGIQDEHLNYIENVIEKFIKMY